MVYKNTVHLKSGGRIVQDGPKSLFEETKERKNWTEGVLILPADNSDMAIPLNNVALIDTEIIEDPNGQTAK